MFCRSIWNETTSSSGRRAGSLHSQKPATLAQKQEYVIASLPGVETKLARALLEKFGTVAEIINATEEQLQKVELIGPKKAAEIRKVVESEYV